MTWIRKVRSGPDHRCGLPAREVVHELPSMSARPPTTAAETRPLEFRFKEPDGRIGDLWRCDTCRALWRIGDACDVCDRHGGWRPPHLGGHALGIAWRPATLWQRLINWRR